MRHVNLGGQSQDHSGLSALEIQRRTGHLNARMEELACDGLEVFHGWESVKNTGWVRIHFPNMEGIRAVELLQRQYQILAQVQDGAVCFHVSGLSSFEDMDYVQGAVMNLLYG